MSAFNEAHALIIHWVNIWVLWKDNILGAVGETVFRYFLWAYSWLLRMEQWSRHLHSNHTGTRQIPTNQKQWLVQKMWGESQIQKERQGGHGRRWGLSRFELSYWDGLWFKQHWLTAPEWPGAGTRMSPVSTCSRDACGNPLHLSG